ncbi:MAG: serine hydrolase domain-containing protein [Streptosporangiales bacterium]
MTGKAGLSADVIDSTVAYANWWLEFRQHYQRIPGVQAAMLFGNEVRLAAAYGVSDIETGAALTPRHLFRIASHSKTFTATAVFQLVEAGAVRLDDRAGDHLSWLRTASPQLADLTVRELLGHGAGMTRDGENSDFWQLVRPFPGEAELRETVSDPGSAVLSPNERFKYSNTGYALLGLVVASASGMPYNDYVSTHIADPLGLSDTRPELIAERIGDYATGHSALSYADTRIPIEHVDTRAMSPATGFTSTAEDVCRYAAAHFFGDTRLVSDGSKRLMQRDETLAEDPDTWYGLGFSIARIGDRRLVGHGGGYPGHSTRTMFDPTDRFAVSVLTNAIDGPAGELATGLVKLLDLAAAPPRQPVGASAADTAAFCGRYANLWGVLDVVRLGDRLVGIRPSQADPTESSLEFAAEDATTLRLTEASGFNAPGECFRYDFSDGRVRSIRSGGGMTLYPIADVTHAIGTRSRLEAPQAAVF